MSPTAKRRRSIGMPRACRTSTCRGSTATSAPRSPTSTSTSRPPRRCSRSSTASRPRASRSRHIDLGGGLGIRYRDETTIDPDAYARAVRRALGSRRHELLFEPGRFLVGEAGVLLTRVVYLKPGADQDFAIVDAAMNDLLRPALYDAWHPIEAVRPRTGEARRWQIVGPVCESGDFLARDRELVLAAGDLLAVRARRRVRLRHELELQLASSRLRGDRRRRSRPSRPSARARRRSLRARIHAAVTHRSAHSSRPHPPFFRVCEFATLAHARLGIAGEILQFNKMWLEFRQQVAVGLSRGCSPISTDPAPLARSRSNITVTATQTGETKWLT